jgi:hypothetical protein
LCNTSLVLWTRSCSCVCFLNLCHLCEDAVHAKLKSNEMTVSFSNLFIFVNSHLIHKFTYFFINHFFQLNSDHKYRFFKFSLPIPICQCSAHENQFKLFPFDWIDLPFSTCSPKKNNCF